MEYRVATAADFEFLAGRWLHNLASDPLLSGMTRDVPEETVRLQLYNAVSSFLTDHRVTTLIEHTELFIRSFAVIAGGDQEVHIAHIWTTPGCSDTADLLKMAALDRKELVGYDEMTYLALPLAVNAQLNYLPLLARTTAGLTPLAKTERPRVLQYVADLA